MVKKVCVGVLGIQGAVSEHINAMTNALNETGYNGNTFVVKQKEDIKNIDALIIPGGESSTISKVLHNSDLYDTVSKRTTENDLAVMGTCAGCVILAKEILNDPKKEIKQLSQMDIQVERNAFGRQKDSFERIIKIKDFSLPYNAVFIRAPIIRKTWGKCKALAKIDEKIVMARQDRRLALSFHPELTDDIRIHKYFLEMI
jgi:5'-phosphate synthase pdxT subunit